MKKNRGSNDGNERETANKDKIQSWKKILRYISNILPIYRVSEVMETIFGGEISF